MKYIIKLLSLVLFATVFVSCEQEEKDPVPFEYEDGGFIKFDKDPQFALNVTDLNSQEAIFSSTLIDPIGNASTYEVSLSATVSGTDFGPVPFKTVTEFPQEFNITPADLAAALGLETSDLGGGDVFEFTGQVTTENGTVYSADPAPNFNNEEGWNGGLTNVTLINAPGYRNAFDFTINYVCPFDPVASAGTYEITVDGFEGAFDSEFEVVAGPGENQITMINPWGHPELPSENYEIIVDVNPETGIASVDLQVAMDSGAFGLSFGLISVSTQGSSFVFSCSGTIDLTLGFFVSAGTFGNFKFVANKVE